MGIICTSCTKQARQERPPSAEQVLCAKIDKAAKDGDLEFLKSLMTNQSEFVAARATHALQFSGPSPKLLMVFETLLDSGTNRLIEGRAIYGIYSLSENLGLQPHRDIPQAPNNQEWNNQPDYWVKVWRDWLSVNKDRLIKRMAERAKVTPNFNRKPDATMQPPSQVVLHEP